MTKKTDIRLAKISEQKNQSPPIQLSADSSESPKQKPHPRPALLSQKNLRPSAVKKAKPNNALRLTLWVTAAFIILIGAWTTLITIAQKNAPEQIELQN